MPFHGLAGLGAALPARLRVVQVWPIALLLAIAPTVQGQTD